MTDDPVSGRVIEVTDPANLLGRRRNRSGSMPKALPLLVDGASIILGASTGTITGNQAFSVYCATKAAIRNFARSWILDLKLGHYPMERPMYEVCEITSGEKFDAGYRWGVVQGPLIEGPVDPDQVVGYYLTEDGVREKADVERLGVRRDDSPRARVGGHHGRRDQSGIAVAAAPRNDEGNGGWR